MKIRNKLYRNAVISIFLIVALIIVVLQSSAETARQDRQRAASRQTLQGVSELDILIHEYLLNREKRPAAQWLLRYESLAQPLAVLAQETTGVEGDLISQITQNYDLTGNLFSDLKALYEKNDILNGAKIPPGETGSDIDTENRLVAQLLIVSQSMISHASILAEKNVSDMLAAQSRGRNLMLFFGLLLLANGIAAIWSVTWVFAKSLDILHQGAEAIGQGDLGHKIDITGEDELGEISATLNRMAANLKNVTASKADLETEIFERKLAEEALLETNGQLNKSQEIAHLGSWELDLASNKLSWSDEVYRIFGLKPQEFGSTYETFLERIHPDDRTAVDAAYAGSIRENKDTYEIDHRVVRKDNGEIRQVHEKCTHVRDKSGRIVRSVGMVHDITERKLAETALRQAEQNYRTIADYNYDWETWVNPDNSFKYVSPSCRRITGYEPADFLRDPGFMKKIVLPADWTVWQEHTHANKKPDLDNALKRIQFRIIRRDGQTRWIEHACLPVAGEQGEFLGYRASNRDITNLKEAENNIREINTNLARYANDLRSVNQELEAFTYSVSHDLRSPLRSMDGFSQALLEDYAAELDEKGRDYLNRIRAGSQKMARLIDDLLRLSRTTRGELDLEEVDISLMANQIGTDLAAKNQGRRFELRVSPDIKIRADRQLMRIALSNLLANSFKYTLGKNPAVIEVGNHGAGLARELYVRDNGIGFNMAYVDKLFQPFQRLHTDGRFEGTGIGLAIVGRIIKKHGGKIRAEATEGNGATFYFTI